MVVKTKEAFKTHICIFTPCNQKQYFPKVWILSSTADTIIHAQTLEIRPSQSSSNPNNASNKEADSNQLVRENKEGNLTSIVLKSKKIEAEKMFMIGDKDDL
jgi:hypothetical protein